MHNAKTMVSLTKYIIHNILNMDDIWRRMCLILCIAAMHYVRCAMCYARCNPYHVWWTMSYGHALCTIYALCIMHYAMYGVWCILYHMLWTLCHIVVHDTYYMVHITQCILHNARYTTQSHAWVHWDPLLCLMYHALCTM